VGLCSLSNERRERYVELDDMKQTYTNNRLQGKLDRRLNFGMQAGPNELKGQERRIIFEHAVAFRQCVVVAKKEPHGHTHASEGRQRACRRSLHCVVEAKLGLDGQADWAKFCQYSLVGGFQESSNEWYGTACCVFHRAVERELQGQRRRELSLQDHPNGGFGRDWLSNATADTWFVAEGASVCPAIGALQVADATGSVFEAGTAHWVPAHPILLAT
jgi:hypothetical protein